LQSRQHARLIDLHLPAIKRITRTTTIPVEGETVMAWIEQTGTCSWRVRYRRPTGSYATITGFTDKTTARNYASDLETDRRRGTWIDPAAGHTALATWVEQWLPSLDVEIRTEENYRAYLRNHILPRWGHITLGDITALDVTTWLKQLRVHYAASTVRTIRTMFSMLLDDAVEQRLIPLSPMHHHRRRGRRRDHTPSRAEKVFAMPEHVLRIAEHATELGGSSAGLLVITAAWTGCRWGELTGLQSDHIDLARGVIVIDPDHGALHESGAHGLWLGPSKTPASARTITLPPFLIDLLREHLATTHTQFVFTTRTGCPIRRSTFDRRVLRPAVDGDPQRGLPPVRPGLTFHGLRHSHKTWLIAEHIPEIAQARRLGHHLANRLVEVYSHVAPEIERHLLDTLERRYRHARRTHRPQDTRPRNRRSGKPAHHTAPRSAPPSHHARNQPRRSSPCHDQRLDHPFRTRLCSGIAPRMCAHTMGRHTETGSSIA
jgi:integrase